MILKVRDDLKAKRHPAENFSAATLKRAAAAAGVQRCDPHVFGEVNSMLKVRSEGVQI